MKDKEEPKQTIWIKIARSPWVQGPVLGSSVMMLVTPLKAILGWIDLGNIPIEDE